MNKLTKVLSIFLIAGLIGTGTAVGLTGCGNKGEEPPQQTTDEEQKPGGEQGGQQGGQQGGEQGGQQGGNEQGGGQQGGNEQGGGQQGGGEEQKPGGDEEQKPGGGEEQKPGEEDKQPEEEDNGVAAAKEDALAQLAATKTAALATDGIDADDTLIEGLLDEIVASQTAAINAVDDKTGTPEAVAAALNKNALTSLVTARLASTFKIKYGDQVVATVAYGQTSVAPTENPTQKGKKFVKWVTTDGGSTAYEFGTKIFADVTIYADWKEPTVAVTLKVDGETYSTIMAYDDDKQTDVVLPAQAYASVKTMPTPTVWYTDSDCTTPFVADSGTVIAETTLHAKSSGWKSNEQLVQADFIKSHTITDASNGDIAFDSENVEEGSTITLCEGNLVKVTTDDTAKNDGGEKNNWNDGRAYLAYYGASATIGGKSFTKALRSSQINQGSAEAPTRSKSYWFTATDKVALTLYVGFSSSNYTGVKRTGSIKYVVNGGEEQEIVNVTASNNGDTAKELHLNPGDVVEVYAYNTSDGSRLFIFDVEAVLESSVTNMKVHVTDSTGTGGEDVNVCSVNAITEPQINLTEGQTITGWQYKVDEGEWTAVTSWASVPHNPNTTVYLKPTVVTADVTVNYYKPSEVAENGAHTFGAAYATAGKSSGTYLAEPTAPELTGYDFVGWYTESTLENEYEFSDGVATATLAMGTLNLYAKFEKTPEKKTASITFSSTGYTETDEDGLISVTGTFGTAKTNKTHAKIGGTDYGTCYETDSNADATITAAKAVTVKVYCAPGNNKKLGVNGSSITGTQVGSSASDNDYYMLFTFDIAEGGAANIKKDSSGAQHIYLIEIIEK